MSIKPDDAAVAETSEQGPSQRPSTGAASVAAEIIAGTSAHGVDHFVRALADEQESHWAHAARVLEEVANQKPELLAPHIERFVSELRSQHVRVAQSAAHALPLIARVAPAKVAKHLKTLEGSWPTASEIARDGLVRTFVALCVASVTYQKKLISLFEQALREAEAKTLERWVEVILPALKGEPYAQAKAIAEARLSDPELPKPIALHVAELLGVKLRVVAR